MHSIIDQVTKWPRSYFLLVFSFSEMTLPPKVSFLNALVSKFLWSCWFHQQQRFQFVLRRETKLKQLFGWDLTEKRKRKENLIMITLPHFICKHSLSTLSGLCPADTVFAPLLLIKTGFESTMLSFLFFWGGGNYFFFTNLAIKMRRSLFLTFLLCILCYMRLSFKCLLNTLWSVRWRNLSSIWELNFGPPAGVLF